MRPSLCHRLLSWCGWQTVQSGFVGRGRLGSGPVQLPVMGLMILLGALGIGAPVTAQPAAAQPAESRPSPAAEAAPDEPAASSGSNSDPAQIIPLDGLTRLSQEHEVWIDRVRKRVVVGGEVCLNRGMLEMFACPQGTKEHESIVALNAKAFEIHAALLAIGARPGSTVQYQPDYRPASGPVIDVTVQWKDDQGRPQSARAQNWIRHVKTGKTMEHDWVFAGSGFWKDTRTGKEQYLAEGGEVICVSNFGTAMLDLPIKSSQDNTGLLFEAFTDHIPPLKTPIRLVLSVKKES